MQNRVPKSSWTKSTRSIRNTTPQPNIFAIGPLPHNLFLAIRSDKLILWIVGRTWKAPEKLATVTFFPVQEFTIHSYPISGCSWKIVGNEFQTIGPVPQNVFIPPLYCAEVLLGTDQFPWNGSDSQRLQFRNRKMFCRQRIIVYAENEMVDPAK